MTLSGQFLIHSCRVFKYRFTQCLIAKTIHICKAPPLLATENWYNLERMFGGLNKVLNWNWSLTLKFMQYDDIKLERKQKNSETSAKRKKGGSGLSFKFFSSVSFLHSYPFLVCPLLQGARRSFCPFWPSAIASSICQATLLTFLSLDALLLQRKTWNWKG